MDKIKKTCGYIFMLFSLIIFASCSNSSNNHNSEIKPVEIAVDNIQYDSSELDNHMIEKSDAVITDVKTDEINQDGPEQTESLSKDINEEHDKNKSENSETNNAVIDNNKLDLGAKEESSNQQIKDTSKNLETEKNDDETKELSAEEVKLVDKAKALALVGKRLSGEQISELMSMAKGGFTAEEKARAKELFYGNFNDEERTWILKMYEKYY